MQRIPHLLLLAILSSFLVLGFHLVGEEGIYTISSMEMRFSGNGLIQTLYGQDLHRPPLMNWLVIPVAEIIGWKQVLVAARLVNILATLGLAGWLYWLCRKLFEDRQFAFFAALAFLTLADLSLYRGWLAYTDPVFSFFTFGAMATLWFACVAKHRGWLLLSILLVSCALLSKAFTAYIFYATVVMVLLWQKPNRRFLMSPFTLIIFCLALIVPYVWFALLQPTGGHSSSMFSEILRKLSVVDVSSYFKHLIGFPLETAFRLSPVLLLAAYFLLRGRVSQTETEPLKFQAALLMTGLCFLPYWLSPQSGIRYLFPIYPLIALVSARYIWRSGDAAKLVALRWFGGLIVFKLLFALILFPYYQSHVRGENYEQAANQILQRTAGHTLYALDDRSIGLNIIGYIDKLRWPQAPLSFQNGQWQDGFLLAPAPDKVPGVLVETYKVAGDETYLLCRGTACKSGKPNSN